MRKPNDFDNVQPYEERKKLPAGGYVCEIKRAEETKSSTGRDMIKIALEIAEGEYRGFFFQEYLDRKKFKEDAKWPYEGTKWQMVYDKDGNTDRTFKGMITSIEAENVKIQWNQNFCNSIKGAMLGVVYGEEETEYNGISYWRAVPKFFCSCEDIRTNNYRVPARKPLDRNVPKNTHTDDAFGASDIPSGFASVEDDIPF